MARQSPVFDWLDRNRDGFLDRDEFRDFTAEEFDSFDRRASSNRDRNGNGVITSDDWVGSAEEFRSLDTDRDGVVTAGTAADMTCSIHRRTAPGDAHWLMDARPVARTRRSTVAD